MKKIIYSQSNGVVAVIIPSEGARLANAVTVDGVRRFSKVPLMVDKFLRFWPVDGAVVEWAETEDEFINRIADKDVPKDATDVQIVDASAIPTDRTFRNAWKADGGVVTHDMPKCKAIAHERRRDHRSAEFAPLDIEATIPAKAAQAEAARQAIRDKYDAMQAAIDAARSVEELKAVLVGKSF